MLDTETNTGRVLVVEDDAEIADVLRRTLRQEGHEVRSAVDGVTALEAAEDFVPDLVILDLGLPKLDGVEVCRRLRSSSDVSILILTARTQTDDRVVGLDAGADDYLVKPFAVQELLARLRAVLRRSAGFATSIWDIGDVRIDTDQRRVWCRGEAVELTPREYQVLIELAQRAGRWMPREELLDRVYRNGEAATMNALEVQVYGLRRKLGQTAIQTIRGVGYMLVNGANAP
jgi:DNA-binding response OmpR family regulator